MGKKLTGSNKAAAFVLLALAACAALLYARTFGHEYVWDDLSYAASFRNYGLLAGAARALTETIFTSGAYYRPLAMLSFAASAESWVQHGINAVLHAVNTALVFLCARALMPFEAAASRGGVATATLGALLFAVHPLAVESTAWVSGRFDTLMCTFVLGISLVVLGGELTHRRLALACVLFFAAMSSKEAAIGLPIALPCLLLLKWRLTGEKAGRKDAVRRLVPPLVALAPAVALYFIARVAVLKTGIPDIGHATVRGGSLLDKFNIAAMAVTAFVKLLVNPWSHSAPLHPFTYEMGSGVQANTLIVLASVLALLVLTVLKKPRLNFPLAPLAALAMSLPTLHFIGIPNGENLISDRYALTPLALLLCGLAAAAGTWLARRAPAMGAGEKRALAYAGVFVLLWACALAAHTNITIPMWRDEISFWTFAHRQTPESERAAKGYITVLSSQERWDEARNELDGFWKKHPGALQRLTISDITTSMLVSAKSGDYMDALAWFELAESGKDKMAQISDRERSAFYAARGTIEGDAGHWNQALHWHEKSVQISPNDARNAFRYAEALFMTGQAEKAEEMFNRALAGSTKDLAAWAVEWRKTWGKN